MARTSFLVRVKNLALNESDVTHKLNYRHPTLTKDKQSYFPASQLVMVINFIHYPR